MDNTTTSVPAAVTTLPSKKSRIWMSVILFVVLLLIYGIIFLFGAGITYLEKPCKAWMEYYIIGFWPAVILFWIIAPCWLILIGKNARWYILCFIIGTFSIAMIWGGYFVINQIYCG